MVRGVIALGGVLMVLAASGCASSPDNCSAPTIEISPIELTEGENTMVTVTEAWETCNWRGEGDEPFEGPVLITVMMPQNDSIATTVGVLVDSSGAGSATLDTSQLAPGTYPVYAGIGWLEGSEGSQEPFAEITVGSG